MVAVAAFVTCVSLPSESGLSISRDSKEGLANLPSHPNASMDGGKPKSITRRLLSGPSNHQACKQLEGIPPSNSYCCNNK